MSSLATYMVAGALGPAVLASGAGHQYRSSSVERLKQNLMPPLRYISVAAGRKKGRGKRDERAPEKERRKWVLSSSIHVFGLEGRVAEAFHLKYHIEAR